MNPANNNFITFIQKILPMPGAIANDIAGNFEQKIFSRNDFILKKGKLSNEYLFLESGFVRSFTYDTEGNEVTTNINSPLSIVFEPASFIKRIPTKENVQALTDCNTWTLPYDIFQTLFNELTEFREFARENLVNGFIGLKERTLAMINLTAEQRYENLLQSRPDLFQQVPLKYLASYLGITDTSLSRIRKDIMHK